ncbi:type II toxin-antitoxin system HipA family toxin [Alteromonas sp. McT4-15]|jgi:serine/threonine-protein kinase HipA|uniref:Kinase n=3 Tax=Alteromonadaceae TaxID=72275 RepID=A0AAC9ACU5_9ALTE|nr:MULTISPECIES: HipA domain-containing protein [Alteromonadales]MEC8966693.1 HipA domain-containing protein [Pseudomonadota bacterium]AFV84671.1 HipA-like protein [Alteromonas mediterranea DE1]AGP96680.1 HipA-like protein [Alteromonas mediterranea UM7]AGQ01016.1 HipA-like protein [Alteromonas mediterranea UM4b]AMJ77842.1 kinase [Alteromonas mediterranea]|tara:strand:+ start:3311 stop:4540 length:1230 start_codon:yes stop_codon:yes gene_type:complete
MTNHVSTLNVLLYGEPIATITNVGNDRTLFAFMDSYINDESRPVLGLGFKDSLGGLLTSFKPTQNKLTPFFSNLLPEETMRNYLAERAGVNPAREFFLLWVLGQDLAGAITVEPADGEALPPNVHQGIEDKTKIDAPMRFSLAGVQLKFSAVQQANGGLTIPATGKGGSWIVKLPSSRFDAVPENEYSMMELARLLGMDVPETQLLSINQIANIPDGIGKFGDAFKNAQAFVIKRFDRAGDQAVHIEDFAQVFGVYPQDKYKKASMRNIAQVIGIEGQDEDIAEFTRRLVFNTLIGNADMHLKNWSVIYKDKRTASIAPAYDFVSTIPYIPDDSASLKVSRSKKFSDFTLDELSHLAAKAMLPEKLVLDTAKQTVACFHEVWAKEKAHLPLTKSVIEAIETHLRSIPLR